VGFYTFVLSAVCRWSKCFASVALCTTSAVNAWRNGSPRDNPERNATPHLYLLVLTAIHYQISNKTKL